MKLYFIGLVIAIVCVVISGLSGKTWPLVITGVLAALVVVFSVAELLGGSNRRGS